MKKEPEEVISEVEEEDDELVTERNKRSTKTKSPKKTPPTLKDSKEVTPQEPKKTAKKSIKKEPEEVTSEVEEEDDEPVTKRNKRSTKAKSPKKTPPTPQELKTVQEVGEEPDHIMEVDDDKPVKKRERKPGSKNSESPKKRSTSPKKSKVKSEEVEELDEGSKSAVEEEIEMGSDDDMKPALADKARQVVAKQLSGKAPSHPFPDWAAGMPTPYAALVKTFTLAEGTTKRLEKLSHASLFLRQVLRLTPDDLLMVIHLMINKLAADYEGVELGIGESLLMKAIGESCGRSMAMIREDQNEIGDLGMVAMKSRNKQGTLFKPKPLTVKSVHQGLLEIATVKGEGGQGRKVAGIKKLLAAAKGDEAKYLVRGLEGKLRTGLAENTVIVALSQAGIVHEMEQKGQTASVSMLTEAELKLRSVFSELPSYDVIIPAMMKYGLMGLKDHCKLQPGVPLKPMLAKPTKSISEVLDRFENKRFTCEYKYDGERAQIHFVSPDSSISYPATSISATTSSTKGITKIFSRNSEDLSKKYPDILSVLDKWVKPGVESFVLDCEAVAWDKEEKRVLPFQQLMTRKRKDVKIEEVKVKVCVFAFDLLFLNGKSLCQETLEERRRLMHVSFTEIEGEFTFATYADANDLEQIQVFLDESVKASCEGLMVKMLGGEESGYEPSKRSRNWLKVKKDYLAGIGDSLDLVVVGAYHGRGKRTGAYGAFLLACYSPSSQTYESVCKIGTGFSEVNLEEFHTLLSELEIERPKPYYLHDSGNNQQPDVWFEPKIVWEVKTADLSLSPVYKAAAGMADDTGKGRGISLRFPRFIRVRGDKSADDATTNSQIADMYKRQEVVTSGSKKGSKGVDDAFDY
ncbi:DNA ligase [Morchella snyderi]|nr:DNA ligase [Morchella snyderi]